MTYRYGPQNRFTDRKKKRFRDSTAVRKLEEAWNENPLLVIGVAAGFMMAASRLIDSVSGIRSRAAYAKRMNRR